MKEELSKLDKVIERANLEIKKLEDKDFNFYFYVYDSKGMPKGDLAYTYETAYQLKELGYKVSMLHSTGKGDTFVGVGEWLGTKYSELPHLNVGTTQVMVDRCDFTVIPELLPSVMNDTKPTFDKEGKPKGLYGKRIVVSQTIDYITDGLPMGSSWGDYKIFDCVTTSEMQSDVINKYFPYVRTKVVHPGIAPFFRSPINQKELSVALCLKDDTLISKILKGFQLKHPQYKWVSFKDLRGLSQELFAEELKNCAIMVWDDPTTDWGYSALEAIKSDTIVLGRIPENISDWMVNEDKTELTKSIVWYNTTQEAQDLLNTIVDAYVTDSIPQVLTDAMADLKTKYTREDFKVAVKEVWGSYVEDYKNELRSLIEDVEKKKAEFSNVVSEDGSAKVE